MVGPLYNPLSTADHARALLLVRLRPEPPFPPCPKPCPPAFSDHTLNRRCPDVFEPSGPVEFHTYLRRQNEEHRAAKERLESCPPCDKQPPRPELPPRDPQPNREPPPLHDMIPPHNPLQSVPKRPPPIPQVNPRLGRFIDLFV